MVDKNTYNRLYDMVEEFEKNLQQEFKDVDIIMFLFSYSLGKLHNQVQKEHRVGNAEDVIAHAVREVLKKVKGKK